MKSTKNFQRKVNSRRDKSDVLGSESENKTIYVCCVGRGRQKCWLSLGHNDLIWAIMQIWNKTIPAIISIRIVVEAQSLDGVTRGELIGCQDLRLKDGTLCNIKIIKGQVHEDPGKEWLEKEEERVPLKQFLLANWRGSVVEHQTRRSWFHSQTCPDCGSIHQVEVMQEAADP